MRSIDIPPRRLGRYVVISWLVLLLQPACIVAKQPLNILFIAVDDLRPEMGCYGVGYAQTPNIDDFAKTALRFTNHFVQVPTCGASRYALLTGRSPSSTGVTAHNNAFFHGQSAINPDQLAGAQTMPELFRRGGYRTVLIGKISHTADGRVYAYDGTGDGRDEVPGAWSEKATPLGSWKRGWGVFFAYADGRHREDGNGNGDVMEFVAENDEDLPDGQMAAVAIKKLAELKEQGEPFFMGLGFFKPHLPFVAPRQDWVAFENVHVPPPPHPERPNSAYYHGSGEFFKYDFPFAKKRPFDGGRRDACRKAYLSCVRYTDRQIGKVLRQLTELGLDRSTVVVLWGDHGWNLGDSAMWAKHTPFERAVRSPLLIRVPGMTAPGRATDALVETVDIYPTLVDLCRPNFTAVAHSLDGKSLRGFIEGTKFAVRDAAISYWRGATSVRTKRYRLIVSPDHAPELYRVDHHQGDPVANIAEDNQRTVAVLSMLIPSSVK